MATDDDDDQDAVPAEVPHGVLRALIYPRPAPMPRATITYSAESTAWALERWQTAGVNAASELRLWRAEYQHAVEQIVGRLAAYTTLEELVAAYYDGTHYPAAERVANLPDGRRLDADTLHAAAFWRRWRELEGGQMPCSTS
jgi:hypothetical protein